MNGRDRRATALDSERPAYPALRELLTPPARRMRILVVEDDESMQDFYKQFFEVLHRREFRCVLAPSAERALAVLRQASRPFDAMVLDWSLPGHDGLALLGALRADVVWRFLPVVMVTARGSMRDDVVAALEAGADDFLSKPPHPDELWARLRGALRRAAPQAEASRLFRVADLSLDASASRLTVHGKPVRLLKKELDLLVIFLRRPNVIHSAAHLWETVWGYENPNRDNVLDVTLSHLRTKLGPKWAARLENHRGQGYLLRCKTGL